MPHPRQSGKAWTPEQHGEILKSAQRLAVITGASKGIGLETARSLAANGWDVALCSRGEKEAETVALRISDEFNVNALGARVDVANLKEMDRFASEISRRWNCVDLLVCNAAVLGPIGTLAEVNSAAVESALRVNVVGVANSIKSLWAALNKANEFRIVALAGGGLGGPDPMLRAPAYVPSKAAIVALVEIMSDEVVSAGGTINAIAPGNIPTSFMRPVLDVGAEVAGSVLFSQAQDRDGRGIGNSLDHFLSLLMYIASSDSASISGRFLSARWNSPGQLRESLTNELPDSLYKLRRIDNDLFGEHPQ